MRDGTSGECGPLVLVADDGSQLLRSLGLTLGHMGYEVITTDDGGRALDLMRLRLPDAVILSWAMPVQSGHEVCGLAKQDPMTSRIPVIMVSSRGTAEIEVARAFQCGADEFVSKQVDAFELDRALRRVLGPNSRCRGWAS